MVLPFSSLLLVPALMHLPQPHLSLLLHDSISSTMVASLVSLLLQGNFVVVVVPSPLNT